MTMRSLEKRVAQLEGAQANANLKTMTDGELRTFICTLEAGTSRWWDALLASVMRRARTVSVVPDDPDHAGGEHGIV